MLRAWLCLEVMSIVLLVMLAFAQSPPQAPCDERLASVEKLVLVLRAERDRAQEQMGQAWSLAERYEKAQKAAQSKPEEKPQ